MTEPSQPDPASLFAHPRSERLYRALVDKVGYWVSKAGWLRARAAGEYVGTCRSCGLGHMRPDPTPPQHHLLGDESRVEWFSAICEHCGATVALPNGKVLEKSSRVSEQPAWWKRQRLVKLKSRDDV
jgi:hypothetical protein